MQPEGTKQKETRKLAKLTGRAWAVTGRFLPWLVLAVSLAFTWQLWRNAHFEMERNLQNDFDFRVRDTRARIEQRLLAYEYVLRGVQGLFIASDKVGRDEFRAYVTNLHLEDNYPGIQGVGFSVAVPPEQKERHIAAIRKEIFRQIDHEYTIWPEGRRDLYSAIVYLEPFAGRNLRAIGYDMYSEPVRRAAMERARDTGRASISGKVRLVQETEEDVQPGFLMYLPLYRNGMLPATIAERRANLIGWAYAPFRMFDLMRGIEGEQVSGIDIEIYDGGEVSEEAFLYDADRSPSDNINARFKATQAVRLDESHHWTLLIHSYPAFEAHLDTHKTEFIAFAGAGSSLLLALLTWSLVRGRERAERAAREMNRELIRSEERARQAIVASHSAVWDYDLATGEVYLSEGWEQLLGGSALKPTQTTIQELAARVPEEEQHAVREAIVNAIKGTESSSYQVTHRVRKYDGEYIWVLSQGEVTERDSAGRALRMVGTNRDITERKLAGDALKLSLHRNKMLFESSRDALMTLAPPSWKFTSANRATLQLFGISTEAEFKALGPWELSPERQPDGRSSNEKAQEMIALAMREGSHLFEWEHQRKDGQTFAADVLLTRMELGDEVFLLATVRDISERKRDEAELRKLTQAVEQSPSSIIITNLRASIEYVNQAFVEITGYSREEVYGRNPRLLASGKTPQASYAGMWTNLIAGKMWEGEFINRRKDGSEYIEAVRMSPVRQRDGTITHYLAVKEDITERKTAEQKLSRSEASLRAILDNIPYLVWLKDAQSRFVAVNHAFFRTTGLSSMDEVEGKTDRDLWPKALADKYRADDVEVMSLRRQKLTEEMSMDNGVASWVETFKAPILDKEGNVIGTTGFARDITERKQAEEVVRHMAHYDALTDLPNRIMLYDRIDQALAVARRDRNHVALMLLDLDRFKPINDTYGHALGDRLLQEAAKRMKECVRESDTVARLGGDEFVVLLPALETAEGAMPVAGKLLQSLNRPFLLEGHTLEISATIGIAVYPEHGDSETRLVKNADVAMYHAKRAGRGQALLYRQDMKEVGV